MEIDLRPGSQIPEDLIELFNTSATDSREKYNQIIADSSQPILDNIDWWAENVSSRNTYACPLFHHVCCLELLQNLTKSNIRITKIVVDSFELSKLIKRHYSKALNSPQIIYKSSLKVKLKSFMSFFYYEWFLLIRTLRLICSKFFLKKTCFERKEYILIDTFISYDYKDEDRWYGSFWDNLNAKQKGEIFFVPTSTDHGISKFLKTLVSVQNSGRNTLFKEEFLNLRDILFAYFHKFRRFYINIGKSSLGDIDCSGLVRECMLKNRDVSSTFEAFLTYAFIRNISKKDVKVKLSIDWFEGHPIDKMWNLGFYRFFKGTKRLAYETFRSFPYYLSTYPIPAEIESKVVPNDFAVQGKACERFLKEFSPNLNVKSVPAFKNEYLWQESHFKNQDDLNILVAFPISITASIEMLDMLISSFSLSDKNYQFILKAHPTVRERNITSGLFTQLPSNFVFSSERSFSRLMRASSTLITEASSVCLESLALGRPVIIMQSSRGLTYDPIPDDISENLYRRCNSSETLKQAVDYFTDLSKTEKSRNSEQGFNIRSNYFEPITSKGIFRFLN
ncbi:CDP-glycerol glycerophosphotransferase family protein [Gammaproteobacteria bacterium]|nr:CDP-glycerol glycerophosphotransferase family protein [Gammaproteobacteria bacterium]